MNPQMKRQQIISQLKVLNPHSRVRLPTSFIHGFAAYPGGRSQLVNIKSLGGNRYQMAPKRGVDNLMNNVQSKVKVLTFDEEHLNFMASVNEALKGGETYPILTLALGTVAGIGSFGAGFVFAAGCTAIDMGRRDSDVLARRGDEIWHVEEIGKIFQSSYFSEDKYVGMHVSSYLLVDPFRAQSPNKGWLLHEERRELFLD